MKECLPNIENQKMIMNTKGQAIARPFVLNNHLLNGHRLKHDRFNRSFF
jgi:hypothetical protein